MGENSAPGYVNKPDHAVSAAPFSGRVAVLLGGKVVVDTRSALQVEETGHGMVFYFPKADIRMDLAVAGDATSYCPFKGQASYHTFVAGGRRSENAAWSYDAPYDEALALKDHLAFYPNRVDAIRVE